MTWLVWVLWTLRQAWCLCLLIFVSYCSNYILFDNQIRFTKTALSRQGHTCVYKCPVEHWLVLPYKYIRHRNANAETNTHTNDPKSTDLSHLANNKYIQHANTDTNRITITNTNTNVLKSIDLSHLTNIYGIAEKNYRPQLLRQKFYPEMCICTSSKCVRSCPW